MKHEKLIINGITYVPEKQEEKKSERLEGWIERFIYTRYNEAVITPKKTYPDDTRSD